MVTYNVGVVVNSKEEYQKLTRKHSGTGMFELSFNKGIGMNYMQDNEYPAMVNSFVDHSPMSIFYSSKIEEIVDDGYTVVIKKVSAE